MRHYVTVILLLVSGHIFAQEVRLGVDHSEKINPKTTVRTSYEFREERSESMFANMFQAKISYTLLHQVSVGFAGRYTIGAEDVATDKHTDMFHKYKFATDVECKTKRWDNDVRFQNRIRAEYILEEGKQKQNVREKITCDYKVNNRVKAYVAYELYYSIGKNEINVQRTYFGTQWDIFSKDVAVYIITEVKKKHGTIHTNNIVGMSVSF